MPYIPPHAFDALTASRESAMKALQSIVLDAKNRAIAEWIAAGGCEKCNGRGWVVTWDTLDSLSGCYHESAPCPNESCTCNTVGRKPFFGDKYDLFHSDGPVEFVWSTRDADFVAILKARKVWNAWEQRVNKEIASFSISVGDTVRIARTLKATKNHPRLENGDEGKIFWIGSDSFQRSRNRVGIQMTNGNRYFIGEMSVIRVRS